MQITLMDATRPEFWVNGVIDEGYQVFPLYTQKMREITEKEILEIENKWQSVEICGVRDLINVILSKVQNDYE